MAELAGKLNEVWILTGEVAMTGATGAKIQGIDNSTYSRLCDILEITAFGDSYKNRIGGLKDTSVSISGNVYTGDTTGQDELEPGDYVFIGIYPQGSTVAGTQIKMIVENCETSASVDGKQTISASLQGCAAPVAFPART